MSDNKNRPHQFGKGKKRTRLSDDELAVITRANLQGMPSADISELFGELTGRQLEQSTIRMVIREQRAIWQREVDRNTDLHFNVELERINMMENEAWERYRDVGGYRKRKDIFKETSDPEGGLTTTTETHTIDDPEIALKWFREILKLQKDRRRLLQLETVMNFTQNNVYAVKGYAGWTPDAWPDPPVKKLDSGNVVDGEYE